MSGNKAPKDARRIAMAEKSRVALDLRTKGWKLEDIAPEVGLRTRAGVKKLIDRAIKRIPAENVDALRAIQHERLLTAVKALMGNVAMGDLDAMDRLIKVEVRLAALFGLDAPKRTELTGANGSALIPPSADFTAIPDAQIDALARGDAADVESPSGAGEASAGGSDSDVRDGGLED